MESDPTHSIGRYGTYRYPIGSATLRIIKNIYLTDKNGDEQTDLVLVLDHGEENVGDDGGEQDPHGDHDVVEPQLRKYAIQPEPTPHPLAAFYE